MEKSILSKRKHLYISKPDTQDRIIELKIISKATQQKYCQLLQQAQMHCKYIQESRNIMKNMMHVVPKWTANIQSKLASFETTDILYVPQENKDFYNDVDHTIESLEMKIETIEQENRKLNNEIEIHSLRCKNLYVILKNIMYAHFSIKMPKRDPLPFPTR